MARIKRYNSETGQWEYCNTGGMPIKGIDYLTKADYDTMRADIDAYLERNKESVGVTVSGNQTGDDVIGAIVRIVGEDGSVLEEKTWNGSELVFRLEAGTVYHVEADASEQGFSSYTSESFTAVKGGARTVVAEVYAEKVNVSVEGIDSGFTVTVKEEYTPCEYIESTGAQYIDTGFAPSSNTQIKYDVAFDPAVKQYSGLYYSSGSWLSFGANAAVEVYLGSKVYVSDITSSGRNEIEFDTSSGNVSINGVSLISGASFAADSARTLPIFSMLRSAGMDSYCQMKLYSCQIHDNGVLVRDYIPVMNTNGVYGLLDKVNGVFYPSSTSTGFSGKTTGVPVGYSECEYIESSGSQYIDTGFVPDGNSRIVLDFASTETGVTNNIIGSRQTTTNKAFTFSTSGGYWRVGYNSSTSLTSVAEDTSRHVADLNKNVLSMDGTAIYTATAATFSGYASIYIGAIHASATGYYGYAKFYSCKIYDNGTLVRDYVPCKSDEGVFGLYDKVNGMFYASATSTGLTGAVKAKTFLTLTETSGSCLVPYGTVYSVSATAVDGYASPSSQTFTASSVSRDVVMTYEENSLGVFIEDVNGKLWTSDAWDGSVTANGVAVCTDTYAFVIALVDLNNSYYSWDLARSAITSYTFPNGQKGYIGTADEWVVAIDNKDSIELALSSVDAPETETLYWTNTSASTTSATFVRWDLGYTGTAYKEEEMYVRAFTTLKRDTN